MKKETPKLEWELPKKVYFAIQDAESGETLYKQSVDTTMCSGDSLTITMDLPLKIGFTLS